MAIELENGFSLDMSPDEAWRLLSDIERIAPCVPGAQLLSVDGDEYRGKVKVKLGPITAEYSGTALIKERSEIERRLVVEGKGKDIRGQGTAGADVQMLITSNGTGSDVKVLTRVQLTGKVAQLGRGVMYDVSTRLIDQFVANLKALDTEESPAATSAPTKAPSAPASAEGPRLINSPEPKAINVMSLMGPSYSMKELLVGLWMVSILVILVLILIK